MQSSISEESRFEIVLIKVTAKYIQCSETKIEWISQGDANNFK